MVRFFLKMIDRITHYALRKMPDRYRLLGTYYKYKIIGKLDEEILILPKLVAKGGVAIDVGANIGIYSYVLSNICNVVESFEQVHNNIKILQAYNAPNINTHEAALSSSNGVGTLNIPTVNNLTIYGHASLLI